MRTWALTLGGLLVWATHFFLIYGIASVLPGTDLAKWLSLLATIPALAADAGILFGAAALRMRIHPDEFDRWMLDLGAFGAILSFIAVAWQALPAVVG